MWDLDAHPCHHQDRGYHLERSQLDVEVIEVGLAEYIIIIKNIFLLHGFSECAPIFQGFPEKILIRFRVVRCPVSSGGNTTM